MNDFTVLADEILLHIVKTPLAVLFAAVAVITVLACAFAASELKRADNTKPGFPESQEENPDNKKETEK